jgi:hypothetical protein
MLHINLLYASERRYQGKISLGFIVRAVLFTAVCLALLLLVRQVMSDVLRARELAAREALWLTLGPEHERHLEFEKQLGIARKYDRELKGWSEARLDVGALLDAFQRMVPPSIQLVRLTIEDEFEQPARRPGAARDAPALARTLRWRLSGRAHGEDAGAQVEHLIRDLKSYPSAEGKPPLFVFVNLLSIQAPSRGSGAAPDATEGRDFEIEARGQTRAIP